MHTTWRALMIFLLVASPALADDNAFTRAVKGPLTGIAKQVPNPRSMPCNGPVDCRRQRNDLNEVWQLELGSDSTKDYPEPCYRQGDNGKYVYSASACRQ